MTKPTTKLNRIPQKINPSPHFFSKKSANTLPVANLPQIPPTFGLRRFQRFFYDGHPGEDAHADFADFGGGGFLDDFLRF